MPVVAVVAVATGIATAPLGDWLAFGISAAVLVALFLLPRIRYHLFLLTSPPARQAHREAKQAETDRLAA